MDPSSLIYLLTFVILLSLSALFSGSETAYFSLPKSTLLRLSRSKKLSEKQVAELIREPKKLLICIIIGNTIVNVAIASLAALLTMQMARANNFNELLVLFLNVIVVTLVILFFSEIVPKVTAVKKARQYAVRVSFVLTFFYFVLYPVILVFHMITSLLTVSLGLDKDKQKLSEEELRTLIDVGEEKGALKKDEKEMIHSIFGMSGIVVREIMVPRTDMVCIDRTATITQVLNLLKEKLHSRIPVYSETVDNIVGILYLKDLLPFIKKRSTVDVDLAKLVHPPYYVPEQKKINEMLREFQAEKNHLAIVVDEYGGTSGLVTLEDVIEEIVGEIQDEYDSELPDFEKIDEDTMQVNARMQLDEINEELGLDLPTEEGVDTLAGFLLGQFGSVPKSKDKLAYNGYEFVIEKATKKRIQLVTIIRKKPG